MGVSYTKRLIKLWSKKLMLRKYGSPFRILIVEKQIFCAEQQTSQINY